MGLITSLLRFPGATGSDLSEPSLPLLPAMRSRKRRTSKNPSSQSGEAQQDASGGGAANGAGGAGVSPSPTSQAPLWAIALWFFPIVLLVVGFGFFLYNSRADVVYPYSLENGEGMSLRWGMMMASGETVYRPLSPDPPFIGCNYPPLYMWLASRFLNPAKPSMFPFRMISILSVLVIGVVIFGLIRLLGGGYFGGIAGALVFFVVPFVNNTATLGRVDWMADALTFCGVWLVWPRREDGAGVRRSVRIAAGLLCMALATFTKQSTIVAPAAFSLWILWRRRQEWYWIVVLAGFGLVLHGIATLATSGQYFLWVGPYTSGRYFVQLLISAIQFYLRYVLFLIVLAAVFGFVLFQAGRKKTGALPSWTSTGERSFYRVYFFLVVVSLASVGRRGSSLHYFIEFTALLCVLAGMLTGRLFSLRNALPRAGAICAVLFSVIMVVHGLHFVSVLTRVEKESLDRRHSYTSRVLRVFRNATGPVLTEDVFDTAYMKKPLYIENPFMYSDLVRRKLIDPKPLLEDIARGRLSFVCLGSDIKKPGYITRDRFAPDILQAVRRAYPYEKIVGNRYLSFRDEKSFREISLR